MIFYIILSLFCVYIFIVFKRVKKYKYNQKIDYMYNLQDNFIQDITIKDNQIDIKENFCDTLFLQLDISLTFMSYIFKPYIEIDNQKYYFEYGAKGIRYINISHMKQGVINKTNIKLNSNILKLYGFKNDIDLDKENVLILAPHADDAEIASFGLYKSAKNVTIVTITAGEKKGCGYCEFYDNDRLKSSRKEAQLRAFDAIATPLLGGVDIKNSMALGYFSSSLKWMSKNPYKIASPIIEELKTDDFRRVSHATLKLKESVSPIYSDFLADLRDILNQLKPTIIVTPHPQIDSHTDHQQTTLSMLEVLKDMNYKSKLLLYTNHLKLSETYPIGDMYTPINLPPNDKDFFFDSIYSFSLDKDLQVDKFFALETIHDLRDSTLPISIKNSFKHFKKIIFRKFTSKDKTYYRRAVRANELFFIKNTPL